MNLEFFTEKESVQVDYPFLDEYIENHPKVKKGTDKVHVLSKVKSGKGYLLTTDNYLCFIWMKAKETRLLLEAIEYWIKNGSGREIYVVWEAKNKGKFLLAADKDSSCLWYGDAKKYTVSLELLEDDISTEINHFLS